MVVESSIQEIYREIQRQLFYMIPEKWNKVYLYASIQERQSHLETGELFFYYIPKGVLTKKPVNVYEVPAKFSIDEKQYLKLVEKLYQEIKKLQNACVELGEEKWNSVVISIADFQFNVEYSYHSVDGFNFNSYERHLIFRYLYLDYPMSSFRKEEKEIILKYLEESKKHKPKTKLYSEAMYQMPFKTIEVGSKNSNIQYIKEDDASLMEEKKEIKSQILKMDV